MPLDANLHSIPHVNHLATTTQYPGAPGYPHCVVHDVLDPAFFRGLREEMVGALSANFKETDLFKLFQTGDLANLDAGDAEMVSRVRASFDAQCGRFLVCMPGSMTTRG